MVLCFLLVQPWGVWANAEVRVSCNTINASFAIFRSYVNHCMQLNEHVNELTPVHTNHKQNMKPTLCCMLRCMSLWIFWSIYIGNCISYICLLNSVRLFALHVREWTLCPTPGVFVGLCVQTWIHTPRSLMRIYAHVASGQVWFDFNLLTKKPT